MLGEFHRRITNEPVNPGLRGRIGRSSDVVRRPRGTVARTGRHADDRAGALMHHQPCCGARAQKGPAKVAPDGEVPGVRCHLPKILIARAARIVDQCVNPLVRGNDLRERVVYRRFLSHVRDECERWRSRKLVSRLRQSCGVEIEQRERRARIGKSPRYCGTYACAAPVTTSTLSLIRSPGSMSVALARPWVKEKRIIALSNTVAASAYLVARASAAGVRIS